MHFFDILTTIDDWPPCHIYVGLRSDDRQLAAIQDLRDMDPATVEPYDLPPMHLDTPESCSALIEYLRARVPEAADIPDHELLGMIAGYPGVINRWTGSCQADISKVKELQALAIDAHNYRYREFKSLVPSISDDERRCLLKLALLPGQQMNRAGGR